MDDLVLTYRNLLMAIAYRMLGSISDAEDMVQETFIEWLKAKSERIDNPKAWLIRVCTNKSIDQLRKAYKQREVYIGTWLPEPVLNSFMNWDESNEVKSPEQEFSLKESMSTTMMILLESLSPMERAVFLLKEVFQYPYRDISQIVNKKEPACRKLFQRSKEALKEAKLKSEQGDLEAEKVVLNFFESAKRGDVNALKAQLASDSQFWSDGGGKVQAISEIMKETGKIAEIFARIFGGPASRSYKFEFCYVNNMPGLIVSAPDHKYWWRVETVFSFEIDHKKLLRIYAMRNPDKLQFADKLQ